MWVCSLTAVGGLSTVGHAHQTGSVHLAPTQILIFEVSAVDAITTCTITACDVSTLDHEFIDHAVKGTERIVEI